MNIIEVLVFGFSVLFVFCIICVIEEMARRAFHKLKHKERANSFAINMERYLEIDRELKLNQTLKRNQPKIKTVDICEQYYKRYNDYYVI